MSFTEVRLWTSYQTKTILNWIESLFGHEVLVDEMERSRRFLEEALELVQAVGLDEESAHKLVSYVYSREVGEVRQEVGGTMVTLFALAGVLGLDVSVELVKEKRRIGRPDVMDKIVAKQLAKNLEGVGIKPTVRTCNRCGKLSEIVLEPQPRCNHCGFPGQ